MTSYIDLTLVFIEGLAIIASPCVFPIVPLLISTSATGGKYRPLAILAGFFINFTLFVFTARYLVRFFDIEPWIIKDISLLILGGFGLILLSDIGSAQFYRWSSALPQWGTRMMNRFEYKGHNDIITGLLIGATIALVWTPCAGPILASVLIQVIRQKDNLLAIFMVLSFAVGVTIPFLLIILLGRKIMKHLQWLPKNNRLVKKILGGIILLSSVLIATEVYADEVIDHSRPTMAIPVNHTPYGAPLNFPIQETVGITQWLNVAQPISLSSLKGNVVIVNFWTYSCYNCVNTIPAIVGWDKKYRDKGLSIVSVHTPEFESDKRIASIQNAIKKHGILYPVAVDNEAKTWDAYHNNCWPAFYFVNKKGQVVKAICGEHNYTATERYIAQLLAE